MVTIAIQTVLAYVFSLCVAFAREEESVGQVDPGCFDACLPRTGYTRSIGDLVFISLFISIVCCTGDIQCTLVSIVSGKVDL